MSYFCYCQYPNLRNFTKFRYNLVRDFLNLNLRLTRADNFYLFNYKKMRFLQYLKEIANSPLAYIGYALVIFLWAFRYWILNSPKSKIKDILGTFKSDSEKNEAIKSLTGIEPPRGLNGKQILNWYENNNRQRSKSLLLLAYLASLLTIILIVGLAYYKTTLPKQEIHKPPILIDERVNKNT